KGFLNILFVYKGMNYNKNVIKGLFLKSCMKTQTTQTQIKEKLEKEFSDEAPEIEIRHIEKKCYASITFTKQLEFEEPHPEVG
ncbi:MAG: hypothetical protein JSW40_05360, partial [Candidatus Omnitrophota bacterium]